MSLYDKQRLIVCEGFNFENPIHRSSLSEKGKTCSPLGKDEEEDLKQDGKWWHKNRGLIHTLFIEKIYIYGEVSSDNRYIVAADKKEGKIYYRDMEAIGSGLRTLEIGGSKAKRKKTKQLYV